jgi:hypothetical protein
MPGKTMMRKIIFPVKSPKLLPRHRSKLHHPDAQAHPWKEPENNEEHVVAVETVSNERASHDQ